MVNPKIKLSTLETSVELDLKAWFSLKNVDRLEDVARELKKLDRLPLIYSEANRREIYLEILQGCTFEQRTYSICEYKEDTFLGGNHYTPEQVNKL